ncbi:hypothetical protein GCM10010964_18600 [Caldovatus sediminis]|uniref:Uncharacterized protein n=1 Tax=Caldovatus sediminis TaxID=2041189 RepID=A0A8J2ZAQ2_9PROT|nr:hypothetical protein GCM10010964_18600 [Caldovatus sediminis]
MPAGIRCTHSGTPAVPASGSVPWRETISIARTMGARAPRRDARRCGREPQAPAEGFRGLSAPDRFSGP